LGWILGCLRHAPEEGQEPAGIVVEAAVADAAGVVAAADAATARPAPVG
jgi:hypothetical protein